MHKVSIMEGTLLHALHGDSAVVNSSHHQAVKDVAPGFIISDRAEDGIVEAIEMTGSETSLVYLACRLFCRPRTGTFPIPLIFHTLEKRHAPRLRKNVQARYRGALCRHIK